MSKPSLIFVALFALAVTVPLAEAQNASTKECPSLRGPSGGAPPWASKRFSSGACGSLENVFAIWSQGKRRAGRELEGARPLDRAAAAGQIAEANKDPEYRAGLAADLSREHDPQRRILIEASWLHEFGFYAARDMKLQELPAP